MALQDLKDTKIYAQARSAFKQSQEIPVFVTVGECDESNNESKEESISEYTGEEEGRIDGLELADGDEIGGIAAEVDQFGLEIRLKTVISQSFDVGEKHKYKKDKQGILKPPGTAKLHD
ncbi:hypothetical protein BU17DRAFT_87995 [Hysterangium stoloniferum]|nr:hypothetical protein BU17DRAFT_87995 [Hysterangium stoloniferum]